MADSGALHELLLTTYRRGSNLLQWEVKALLAPILTKRARRSHLPASLVNTSHYPLNYPRKPLYQRILTATRTQLKRDGCAVVLNFLSPLGLSKLLVETAERRKFSENNVLCSHIVCKLNSHKFSR